MKEFDHIVWPTPAETKKYFITVVSMITILTVFLFIIGTAFSVGIFAAKKQFVPVSPVSNTSTQSSVEDLKIDDIKTTTIPATPTK